MKKKIIITILAALLCAATFLAACNPTEKSLTEKEYKQFYYDAIEATKAYGSSYEMTLETYTFKRAVQMQRMENSFNAKVSSTKNGNTIIRYFVDGCDIFSIVPEYEWPYFSPLETPIEHNDVATVYVSSNIDDENLFYTNANAKWSIENQDGKYIYTFTRKGKNGDGSNFNIEMKIYIDSKIKLLTEITIIDKDSEMFYGLKIDYKDVAVELPGN